MVRPKATVVVVTCRPTGDIRPRRSEDGEGSFLFLFATGTLSFAAGSSAVTTMVTTSVLVAMLCERLIAALLSPSSSLHCDATLRCALAAAVADLLG